MERDSANMYVLEAILLSMILLGAAYAVQSLQGTSQDQVRPQNELERLVRDALVVLEGLDDGNGTSLLDIVLLEALHCSEDAVPSSTDCDNGRSRNMSIKLESYLPRGAGYAFGIANGVAHRDLYRSPQPIGEAVSTSITIAPEWNTTFVTTEFSCYPTGVDINATLIPIDGGRVPWTRWGNLTVGATEYGGTSATTARWWNATIPAAGRAASGTTFANLTGNASLKGGTTWAFCDHNSLTTPIRNALWDVTFAPSATSVPLGERVTFAADLTPLESVVTVNHANLTIYEPIPIRNATADTWIVTSHLDLPGASAIRSTTWAPPETTLYGAHPALLRVNVTAGTHSFELHRVALIDVALISGEVPLQPPYRATLQAWLPDWG